jgi:hypothetical protein
MFGIIVDHFLSVRVLGASSHQLTGRVLDYHNFDVQLFNVEKSGK